MIKSQFFKKALKKAAAVILASSMAICPTVASAKSRADTLGEANYLLLQDIIDLYLETSLYDSTREELVDTMILNYLKSNPYMFAALANSLLSANDNYSRYYLESDQFMNNEAKGLGVLLKSSESFGDGRTKGIYIDEVLPNSNAKFAGVLSGDRIVSVEGIDVTGLSIGGIQRLISIMPLVDKDPEKSKIVSQFKETTYDEEMLNDFIMLDWDPKKEIDFVFERILSDGSILNTTISMPRGQFDDKCVYYELDTEASNAIITITSFGTQAVYDDFKEALTIAQDAGCKNLIIDLRDNPGGYFDLATKLGDMFTKDGEIMFYTRTRESDPVPTKATAEYVADKFEKYIVMVNENTASAAELLAHIMRAQTGAAIIGETSFGKAVGQDYYNVANGDSFTITTFEILKNDMTAYNEIGIIPDVEVPVVREKYNFPEGLSHFNHTNYVTITENAENDAVLALEQRFGVLGLLENYAIDGKYDSATKCAIMIYKALSLSDKNPDGTVTYEMVTSVTETINTYKDHYYNFDSQLETAKLYLINESRGKRLAKEYINANKKHLEERERIEKERMEELRKQLEEEQNQFNTDINAGYEYAPEEGHTPAETE